GTMKMTPGPLIPENLPRRKTTTFSHWSAILIAIAHIKARKKAPTAKRPPRAGMVRAPIPMAKASKMARKPRKKIKLTAFMGASKNYKVEWDQRLQYYLGTIKEIIGLIRPIGPIEEGLIMQKILIILAILFSAAIARAESANGVIRSINCGSHS